MAIRKSTIPNIFFIAAILLILNAFPAIGAKQTAMPKPEAVKAVKAAKVSTAKAKTDTSDTVSAPAASTVPGPDVPVLLAERYKKIANSVDMDRVKASVTSLSSYPSRMVGYPGTEKAADYVIDQFRKVGLRGVKAENFKVTVPIDEGSKLVVNGKEFPIYGLWPNLVRTSQLPPNGLTLHLIDGKSGRLPDFDGKVVKGSAALVDFNTGTEWLNAPRLGARVLIFVEPDTTMRGECEAKFSSIPVSMPRFWISKKNAAELRAMLADFQAKNSSASQTHRPQLQVKVYCKMPWEKVNAKNIVGILPGTDKKLSKQWIVFHASYDASSVVPSLAPGAESTCGISSLIELARLYANNPELRPKRSVMFIATSGHFQGLAGMRSYMERHIDSYRSPGNLDGIKSFLNRNWPSAAVNSQPRTAANVIAIVCVIIFVLILLQIIRSIWHTIGSGGRRPAWIAVIPVVLGLASVWSGYYLSVAFVKGFNFKVADPKRFYLWCGLDLSSQTQGVGLFYKGYFYDCREDIQSKFSDLAGRTRENSDRVAYTLGFYDQRAARFADGINPIMGKNWRNFIPGKIALDSEVVTLAGGTGVSFVSTDDGRQLVDTPFDTADKVNFGNLKNQLTMIACLADHWFHDTTNVSDEDVIKADVVKRDQIKINDPLRVGYVQGVYTSSNARGRNYYTPKKDKDMPESLRDGEINLTAKLPAGTKQVYLLHKPLTKLGVTDESQFTRMGLQGGFARLSGHVVQYDPRKSFVPNLRVGDCLAVVRSPHKSFMGVRANIVDKTTPFDKKRPDNTGYFEIPGVAPVTAYGYPHKTSIGAYKIDPDTGDIAMAPDQGSYGEFYPTEFTITTGEKDMPIIVFDCKATSIYDLIDPQSLRALSGISIYDGDTNGAPKQFGMAIAVPEPQNPHVENMAVVFTEDTAKSGAKAFGNENELRRIRIKIIMSAGPGANRLLLLNAVGKHEVLPVNVVKTDGTLVTMDTPMQVFVRGVYTNPECKGKNYLPTVAVAGPYSDPMLLDGRIRLKYPLPADTQKIFVKPEAKPEGMGYDFTNGGILDETAYKVAHDMWTLDEDRLSGLEEKGVVNDGLSALHKTSKRFLDLAEEAKGSLNYSVFDSYCRAAWGYEARAYPDVTATAQDVVNGVIFYLFLMLPFAFFCERLFFAFPDLKLQLLAFFGIFGAIYFVFWLVHPAFQIAGNPLIVLIAFVMLALSALVIFIVTGKFEEQLQQLNQAVGGAHKADIGRMSVAAAAFSLGISNMRRRKARTVLTCITLVLLTFTVLSFTSIVSVLRFNKVPAKKDADTHVYDGIMIRTAMWEPLQEIAYHVLRDEFGNPSKHAKVYPVAPRAWFFGTLLGEQSFLTLRKGDLSYDAKAATGMVPDEAQIMDFNTTNHKAFVAGDWFGYKNGKRVKNPVDPYSIIIPSAIADKLAIRPEDVGKVKVDFGGAKYTVIAIIKNDVFKRIKDLDNEPLTPVDFILMNKQSQQQQQSMGDSGFRQYTHMEPDSVFIVPYDTLMSMGGDLRSIAIKFASVGEVQKQLDSLMPRLGLNLYAGVDKSIYRYSSIASSSSKGFSNVFIPVLIAALIVLNTMLGSVFERVREIGIFSSIGLAPNHIAVLFIAESMVYANLGAVAGYVVGQAVSKLLMATNLLPGLYLNFSSMSAVTSTIIVVAVVLLSTLYPAKKASEVATPSIDRSWKVPDPVGDNWEIVLPFAVTGEQAVGVNAFLKEWFLAYEEYSIGDFVTQGVKTGDCESENGKCYTITTKTWLAPFDLGVSQNVLLKTEPTAMEDVYEVKLNIHREGGDISNWKRVNRRFLNTLRRQFLIWRTLRVDEREKYLQAALADADTAKSESGKAATEVAPA